MTSLSLSPRPNFTIAQTPGKTWMPRPCQETDGQLVLWWWWWGPPTSHRPGQPGIVLYPDFVRKFCNNWRTGEWSSASVWQNNWHSSLCPALPSPALSLVFTPLVCPQTQKGLQFQSKAWNFNYCGISQTLTRSIKDQSLRCSSRLFFQGQSDNWLLFLLQIWYQK